MSSDEQHHGHLLEHKLVVKSWNASQQHGALRGSQGLGRKSEGAETDTRVMQWLRGEPVDEREEDSDVTRSAVLPYEPSVADSEDQRSSCSDLEEDGEDDGKETCPRTVGQIKHAYRTRARKEEAVKDRRAFGIARKQKERLRQYQLQAKSTVKASDSRAAGQTQDTYVQVIPTASTDVTTEHGAEDPDEFRLDAGALVAHSAYRDSMLRVIRRHLSSGRNAVLSVVLPSADSSVELSSLKLALQQLCSESLLFCVRDQNVLASVDHERGVVTLELLTRQLSSNMATLY